MNGCSENRNEVGYNELVELMNSRQAEELCHWYYDALRSNSDNKFHHVEYVCFPTLEYRGSEIERKIITVIKKTEADILSSGGELGVEQIRKL